MTGHLAELLENLEGLVAPPGFAEHYVRRLPDGELLQLDPIQRAEQVAAHLRLGAVRRPGETKVEVLLPGDDHPGESILLLIVTDDRPFLVDTVSMDITRSGWNIRGLVHPQYEVRRDADGVLQAVAGNGTPGLAESWICVEVFPPLGRAADTLAPELRDAVVKGVAAVELAVDDGHPMERRLTETIDWLNEHPQPVSPHEVRSG
ncbi:MAG: NAD-glutamate dehydrogenase, partial [Micropruina sp.]|nr:NAD-glutamate dehydrogenase [Micropruina sp.]